MRDPRQILPSCLLMLALFSAVQVLAQGTPEGAWYLSFPMDRPCPTKEPGKPCQFINSIFDHSVPTGFYCKHADGRTVAFTGEEADIRDPTTEACSLPQNQEQGSYLNPGSTPNHPILFDLDGKYLGVNHREFLNYDGHSGHDLQLFSGHSAIRAAADGMIYIPTNDSGGVYGDPSCYHIFAIDHLNGYETWYLHAAFDASFIAQPRQRIHVNRGDQVATVSGTGCVAGTPPREDFFGKHLHFEVRQNLGGKLIPVDPFGWEHDNTAGCSDDIYTRAFNTNLWSQSQTRWNFDTNHNLKAWTPMNMECFSVHDNALFIDPRGQSGNQPPDPQLVSPPLIGITAPVYKSVEIEMRSNATDGDLSVFFATSVDPQTGTPKFDEDRHVHIPPECPQVILGDNQFHVYKIPMTTNPFWSGDIKRIRIDPSAGGVNGPSDTSQIRYIALSTSAVDCSGNKPPSDFSLFISPLGKVATQGGSASFTVTVTQTGNPQTVTLSMSNPPAGTSASFNPPTINSTVGSSILTITTSKATPLGDSFFDINGTAGGSMQSLKLIGLTVNSSGGNACNTINGLPKVATLSLNGNELWGSGQGQVFVVDVNTLNVQMISIPGFPDNVIGKIGFLNGNAYVPIGNGTATGNQLAIIDAVNKPHTVIGKIAVDRVPSAVIPFGNLLYVTRGDTPSVGKNSVDVVDPTNLSQPVIKTIDVGGGTLDMAVDTQTALGYTLDVADHDITVIDLNAKSAVQTIKFPSSFFNTGSSAITFSRSRLYVATALQTSSTASALLIIDPRNNNSTIAQIDLTDVTSRPFGVATAGNLAFVTGESGNNVTAINIGTNKVMTTVATGVNPGGIVVDSNSGNLYVANAADGSISVICAAQTIPFAGSIAFDPPTVRMGSTSTVALQLTGPSPGFSTASFSSSSAPGSIANFGQRSVKSHGLTSGMPTAFASVDVPDGASSTNVAFKAPNVSSPTAVDITGTFNGASQTATLVVMPAPLATPSSSNLEFGNQVIGSNIAKSIQLTNTGTLPLNISSINASGDFQEKDGCKGALAPGVSCTITVSFVPHATGPAVNAITIIDDADDSPQNIFLSGNGTDFSMGVSPNTPSSQTITAGQTATYHLSLAGFAGFTGAISLSCGGLPPQSQCAFSPPQISINDSTPVSVDMSVFTSATSKSSAIFIPNATYTHERYGEFIFAVGLCALLLSTLTIMKSKRKKVLCVAVMLVSLNLASCGGGGSTSPPPPKPGTPTGTSAIVVTGIAGTASRTTNVTLIVQ